MKKAFRQVQFLANIATIGIAVLLSIIVVNLYILPEKNGGDSVAARRIPVFSNSSNQPPTQINPVGQSVSLPNIEWAKNKKTLVLYISATCRYCTESAPFYQRLLKEINAKGVTLVAVMPQSPEEGKEYLKKLDVKIDTVLQSSLQAVGVRSTPSLLIVNELGVVTDYWRGMLPPEKENEVIDKLTTAL